MKVELGISVLSKRETMLGLHLTTHNGVNVKDGQLHSERVVEFSIGVVFAILTIGFATIGDKIDTPNNVMKAIEAFENELEK
jgi:hypothetical protein